MQKLQSGLVIEFYSNSCLVRTDIGDIKCLAIKNIVVGDKVSIELIQDSKEAKGIIVSREQRNSFLEKRDGIKSKAVAANISHVGILITPEPITSTEFIDKWLLTAHSSGITPFIINNKIDLNQNSDYKKKLKIYEDLGLKIIAISAKKDYELLELNSFLESKCVIFVGNSGAGKSTLTTKLTGRDIRTNALSNNQGMHTTSISTLYELNKDTKIIDSPGVRDLPISGLTEAEIIQGFSEIYSSSKACKFNDCNHIANDGCMVLSKLMDGDINESRYNNFIKFRDGELDE